MYINRQRSCFEMLSNQFGPQLVMLDTLGCDTREAVFYRRLDMLLV
jgi:hypothetical protein